MIKEALTPQSLYIILVLPGILGLVLIGEGINKCVHQEIKSGLVNIFFGIVLLFGVILSFLFWGKN